MHSQWQPWGAFLGGLILVTYYTVIARQLPTAYLLRHYAIQLSPKMVRSTRTVSANRPSDMGDNLIRIHGGGGWQWSVPSLIRAGHSQRMCLKVWPCLRGQKVLTFLPFKVPTKKKSTMHVRGLDWRKIVWTSVFFLDWFKNAGEDSIVTRSLIVLLIRVLFPEISALGFRRGYVVLGVSTSKSIYTIRLNGTLT